MNKLVAAIIAVSGAFYLKESAVFGLMLCSKADATCAVPVIWTILGVLIGVFKIDLSVRFYKLETSDLTSRLFFVGLFEMLFGRFFLDRLIPQKWLLPYAMLLYAFPVLYLVCLWYVAKRRRPKEE